MLEFWGKNIYMYCLFPLEGAYTIMYCHTIHMCSPAKLGFSSFSVFILKIFFRYLLYCDSLGK